MRYNKTYFAGALAVLLVIGFLATSIISYLVTDESLREQIAEESLPLTSDNIYSEIERDLLRSILISSLMAHDTFVRDWALAGEKEPQRITRYLKQIQDRYETTTAFFVSEKSHKYYHSSGELKIISKKDPADAWYYRAREMNDPYEINLDYDTADRNRLNIFINYRVTDYNGKFIGVTGIGLSVERVADLIESYQNRYSREIYFVSREGEVTVRGSHYEGPERIQSRPGMSKIATHILTNPSTSLSYERPGGETVYVNSRLVPELDWHLIVEQAESASDSRILNTLLINIVVALLITLLVLLIAWFTLRGYQRRLEEMATTDKLTGAANRHVFEMIFNHDVSAAKRSKSPLSLISIDIDKFKEINDTYGHQGGDTILRCFSAIVRANIRDADTFCRWGGDEFLILMSGQDLEHATQRAEVIREAVRNEPFRIGGDDLFVTISMGVVQREADESFASISKRADNALYESKKQGRDQVTSA